MRTRTGKKIILTLFLASVLTIVFNMTAIMASSENVIVAVYGSTPTINGLIEDGEWDDASTVKGSVTGGVNCTVYAKQDGVNLYVGFKIPDVTYNSSDCCVIIFDVNHDGSTSLLTDDMWFAVSRTSTPQEYNVSTILYPPGWHPTTVSRWTAKTSSTSSAWQCEYNITYPKLGTTAGTNKTLGVMFLIVDKDVEMGWYVWPSDASITSPVSWGDMTSNGYNWVPEFSTWASLFLLFIVLTVAIAVCKRRLLETSLH